MGISLLLCGERNNHRMAPRDLPWSLGNKLQQERQPMASTSHQVSRHWQHSPLASCKGSVWAWKTILMLTKTSPLCPPYKETTSFSCPAHSTINDGSRQCEAEKKREGGWKKDMHLIFNHQLGSETYGQYIF